MKWNYNYDKEKRIGVGDPSCEYPWEQEFKDETNGENGKTSEETEFIQSTYNHEYLNKENEFYNGVYYDMLFKDDLSNFFNCGYWLSSRSSYVVGELCGFGFSAIRAFGDYGKIGNYGVYYSDRNI